MTRPSKYPTIERERRSTEIDFYHCSDGHLHVMFFLYWTEVCGDLMVKHYVSGHEWLSRPEHA